MLNVPSGISDRTMIIYLKLADCQFQRLLKNSASVRALSDKLLWKSVFLRSQICAGIHWTMNSQLFRKAGIYSFIVIGNQNPCPENSKKIFWVDTFLLVKQSKRIKNANFGRNSPYNFSLAPILIVRLSCCLKKKIAIYLDFNL